MLIVETIRKIRCAFRDGKPIRRIARDFNLSRNTVKKAIRDAGGVFVYARKSQAHPKLGVWIEELSERLSFDKEKPKRERRTAYLLFEELQRLGFEGGYDSVRRYVRKWREGEGASSDSAYIPLSFAPGEAFQFDWSHEMVELGGEVCKVKVAHFRLCYSRMPFCVAYHRESLEMVLDAHIRAFEFFGGVSRRGIYDNLKTVVTKILMGKDRKFNRRFEALASHYMFEPVACTPASGWEKGQVESQVAFIRGRLFVPRLKFADIDELNRWLSGRCRTLAAGHKHPEFKDKTVAEYFADEQQRLKPASQFDGYREDPARVSSTSLVAYDSNRYSVAVSAVGRTAMLRAYADRIVIMHDGQPVGEHKRMFGRDKVSYNPWHYLNALERKPGALRNGAPFLDWTLPEPLENMRQYLAARPGGDREFVGILGAIAVHGLEPVSAACSVALAENTASRDIVLNILSRARDEPRPEDCPSPPDLPQIKTPPAADCKRYDSLLSAVAHA